MRKVFTIVAIVAAGMLLREHFQQKKELEAARAADARQEQVAEQAEYQQVERDDRQDLPQTAGRYSCDGRKRCPEMTSCEEATWFIEHCSGMEMDGDQDGVPCESQWCSHAR